MKIRDLKIPKDIENKWQSSLIPKPCQRYTDEKENNFWNYCVKLCFTGCSYRKITKLLKKHYDIEIYYYTLRRMIKSGKEVVDKFRSSSLSEGYVVLYLDAKQPNGTIQGWYYQQ